MQHIKMNKKIDISKIDIDKLNPYKTEDNLLYKYYKLMFFKKNGKNKTRFI